MQLRSIMFTGGMLATLAVSGAANAAVVGTLGTNAAVPFASLSTAGLNGGSAATLSGGTVYTSDQPFADIPAGAVFENRFLAAGPSSGNPATLVFAPGTTYLSFVWGSPDTYNLLRITTLNGSATNFTVDSMGFSVTNGDQSFSQPVQFSATAGDFITSAIFSSVTQDAFEVANFRVAAVPEPATWGLMIAGFGLVGGTLRRRQRVTVRYA